MENKKPSKKQLVSNLSQLINSAILTLAQPNGTLSTVGLEQATKRASKNAAKKLVKKLLKLESKAEKNKKKDKKVVKNKAPKTLVAPNLNGKKVSTEIAAKKTKDAAVKGPEKS